VLVELPHMVFLEKVAKSKNLFLNTTSFYSGKLTKKAYEDKQNATNKHK